MAIMKQQKKRGAALLIIVLFFVMISLVWVVGTSSSIIKDYIAYRNLEISKRAYYLAESGVEDALYRVRKGWAFPSPVTISPDANSSVVTTLVNVNPERKSVSSIGAVSGFQRKMAAVIVKPVPASFPYAVETGAGGLVMEDTSSFVDGDIFARGPIAGAGSTAAGAAGAVFSGTPTTNTGGSITNMKNTGASPMFASTISHATIGGNAFCSGISLSSTTTCTALYPFRINNGVSAFPLTDAQVANWKATAAVTVLACNNGPGKYRINSSVSLGESKIPCDFEITGGGTLTLSGPLWITGSVDIKANSTVNVVSALGSTTVPIIADPELASDRDDEGIIEVENSTNWNTGVGQNPDAHILLFSWNTDPSDKTAIKVTGSPTGNLMVYAPYGEVKLDGNNVAVKQATGYKVLIKDGAEVNYTNNLQNTLMYGSRFDPWHIYNLGEI